MRCLNFNSWNFLNVISSVIRYSRSLTFFCYVTARTRSKPCCRSLDGDAEGKTESARSAFGGTELRNSPDSASYRREPYRIVTPCDRAFHNHSVVAMPVRPYDCYILIIVARVIMFNCIFAGECRKKAVGEPSRGGAGGGIGQRQRKSL